MQITPHIHAMHIDDGAVAHPGGSNNYFVGDPSEGMVIIDTGDHHRDWTTEILKTYEELGSPRIIAIVLSHGHVDHVGGVDRVFEAVNAPVRCHPKLAKRMAAVVGEENVVKLRSGEVIPTGGGVTLRAIFTPGHEVDHVCYYLAQERVLFTGDTILGASSSTVSDLADYMKSLRKLASLRVEIICPAHGPVVPKPRAAGLVTWYINHRDQREQEVLTALRKGISDPVEMVRDIYPRNLKKGLRHSAERNVRTHLAKLVKDGVVAEVPTSYRLKRR